MTYEYTYGELYDAILSVDINNTSHIVNLTQSKKTLNTKILLIQELSFVEQTYTVAWGIT